MTETKSNLGFTMKLELVPIPTADPDRAIAFYAEKLGFKLDHDTDPGNGMRVAQLTPPGSACSILISKGLPEISEMPVGSVKGLHLVVPDIAAAREALLARAVDVGTIIDHGRGVKSAPLRDPDGNLWLLQELPY